MNDTVVKSNKEYLEKELNQIITSVNGLTTKSTTYNGGISNSTTNIPSTEPSIITDFLTATQSMYTKFTDDLKNIIEIATKFDDIDKLLKSEATAINMILTSTALEDVSLSVAGSETAEYDISNDTQQKVKSLKFPKINLDKYAENKKGGFYLWISGKRYTIKDFENSIWRKKYGYTPEQALESFIGCIIAESDKTIDDVLAVTSVILNRAESPHWGKHYQNGTNPFDQLFAKNGGQFAVITQYKNGYRRYERYMPSVVGLAKVKAAVAEYGSSYEELRNTIIEALEGGVRNHDYTGFRANAGYDYDPIRHITPKGNKFHYEVRGTDDVLAAKRRENMVAQNLSGGIYQSSRTIMVEKGSNISNITSTLGGTGSVSTGGNTSTIPTPTETSENPGTGSSQHSQTGGSTSWSSGPDSSPKKVVTTEVSPSQQPSVSKTAVVTPTPSPSPSVATAEGPTPIVTSTIEKETIPEPDNIDNTVYETNNNSYIEPVTPIVDDYESEVITPEPTIQPTESKKSNTFATAVGLTAAVGAAAGAGIYGYKKYKEQKESEEEEFEEEEE